MIVVHVCTTIRGGAGIALLRQHAALKAAGVDSRIIVGDGATAGDASFSAAPRAPRSVLARAARRLPSRMSDLDGFQAELRAAVDAPPASRNYELFSSPFSDLAPETHPWIAEADVVNVHWVAGSLDWPRFFSRVAKPVVFTLHDQQPYLGGFHYTLDRDRNPQLAALESRVSAIKESALRRPVQVVGNSDWNTRAAEASVFFPAASAYRTIYYALDIGQYTPRPKRACRNALGLDDQRLTLGFASADLGNRRKGFDTVTAAIHALPRELRAVAQLVSFGAEPARGLPAQIGLPWVHLGHLESDTIKVAAYSAMDVFIAPSLAEAFGQTAIEALACETAVVASDVGGLREALDHGQAGHLVPPGDAKALADSLSTLARDAALRARLAAAGRAHVTARHAPAVCASRYLQVYEQAIRPSKAS